MKIVTYPNKILSQTAEPVQAWEMDYFKPVIKNMLWLMRTNRGLGLAAPQVGISKRIVVWVDQDREKQTAINPVIVSSRGKIKIKEGCLSLPNIQREIQRKRVVVIEALDENGKRFKQKLENIDAVIVQHEIDHLNGITILDSAKKRGQS